MMRGRKRYTHERQLELIAATDENIEVIDRVGSDKQPINCRCKKCGYEWETTANKIKNGKGCPRCVLNKRVEERRKSRDCWISELKERFKDIYCYDLLPQIIENNHITVNIICKNCGLVFPQKLYSHAAGHGCPRCSSKSATEKMKRTKRKLSKSHGKELLELLSDKFRNLYDYSFSEYKGWEEKIEIVCKRCGRHFWQRPGSNIGGCGCSACATYGFSESKPSTLYVLCDDPYQPNMFKVGITNNFETRFDTLSRNTPFNIYKYAVYNFPAGSSTHRSEKYLHEMFSDFNAVFSKTGKFDGSTEWFFATNILLDSIQAVCL
ncbi:MAG: GIY-YIG nuclease family protein [Succinivibrio sp.]